MSNHDRQPRVAIVGAGIGGIATAVYLVKQGFGDLTIFEKSAGVGGTWFENRYPGAECDVPSHVYSYSFHLSDWSRTHAGQGEIQRYLESVIDRFGLRHKLRLSTPVALASWDKESRTYGVETADGESHEFDVLVSAVGMLNIPRYPEWPGLEDFEGPKFHTARWEDEHDLADMRVAVVGTGSTATQLVPALAPRVKEVVLFQREPGWIVPKGDHDFDLPEIERYRRPLVKRLERWKVINGIDKGMRALDPASQGSREARDASLAYIESVFAERPDLAEAVTPRYPFRCKRLILTSNFYPSLLRDDVRIVTEAVASVTRDGIVDATGAEHKVDCLVMATGFQPWNFLANWDVRGREGRSLHEAWGEQPEAFMGLTVPGFPNFYMLYGPNTNGGCLTFTLECQARYVARAVRRMSRGRATALEVSGRTTRLYNRWLDRGLTEKPWDSGCNNYYHSETGKNVTQWPWTHARYWAMTKFLGTLPLRAR